MRNIREFIIVVVGSCLGVFVSTIITKSLKTETKPELLAESRLTVSNKVAVPVTAYFDFAPISEMGSPDWSKFNCINQAVGCSITIPGNSSINLPVKGYLNVIVSFNHIPGCLPDGGGTTQAEINMNVPDGDDVVDISLVNGFTNWISLDVIPPNGLVTQLGPPIASGGNENVFGVYPVGCDICTARKNPPCGIQPGTEGCKKCSDAGPDAAACQYRPKVPCQFTMPKKSSVIVSYLGGT